MHVLFVFSIEYTKDILFMVLHVLYAEAYIYIVAYEDVRHSLTQTSV